MAQYSLFPTAIGECGIAWQDDLVVGTQLPEASAVATASRLASHAHATEADPPPVIRSAIESITSLLEGQKNNLTDIACDFSGLEGFAVKVYSIARTIPVGETLTYGEIASQLGNLRLAQNVGRALGRNPLPIIVPCHRVIGAGGKPTGFSAYGGVETKLKMLRIEGAQIGGSLSLFDGL